MAVKVILRDGEKFLGSFTLHEKVGQHLLDGGLLDCVIGGYDPEGPYFTHGSFQARKDK